MNLNALSPIFVMPSLTESEVAARRYSCHGASLASAKSGIAPLPDCQSDPVQAIEVNTLGLVNLLEAGRRTGIKQLVQASTNAMYENETEFPTVESKFNPPHLLYPHTK